MKTINPLMRKIRRVFIVFTLLPLISADLPKTKENPEKIFATIINAIPSTFEKKDTTEWVKKLAQMISNLNITLPDNSNLFQHLYHSTQAESLLVYPPLSDKILVITPEKNRYNATICPLDINAIQLARTIWTMPPYTQIQSINGNALIPIQPDDFSDLLVLSTSPNDYSGTAVLCCINIADEGRMLLLFDKPFFADKTHRLSTIINKIVLQKDDHFSAVTTDMVITLRYLGLLYGFSYQVMIDSIQINQVNKTTVNPSFTSELMSYWKLLSESCNESKQSKLLEPGIKSKLFIYPVLAFVYTDILENEGDSAAALVYWTLFQKKWLKISLISGSLECDLETMSLELPEYHKQLEKQILNGTELKTPDKYSYLSIKELLKTLYH